MAYSAVVTRIYTKPHPNADKLQLGNCRGYQVVLGKDTKDGELGVFFPCDGQLSDEFCKANDLYPRFDANGKRIGGGFIEPKNRRVRSQNFRGQKSEGFWVPISYFSYMHGGTAAPYMEEGFSFTELEGRPICNKYFNEATLQAIARRKKKGARRETTMFKAHLETEQLRKCLDEIPNGSMIIITEKLHGTSQRYGNVLHEQPLPWWAKAINWATRRELIKPKMAWTHVIGTRNVILDPFSPIGEKYREQVIEKIKGILRKGETLYFEIVGFDDKGTPIMIPQDTTKLQDKEISKRYGEKMIYLYGTKPPNIFDMYVYRITMTNEDGEVFELPWEQVKYRCGQLGVKHVPELMPPFMYRKAENPSQYEWTKQVVNGTEIEVPPLDRECPECHFEFHHDLVKTVEPFLEGCSTLDPQHIREGVCVRVEGGPELLVYKEKSFTFKVLEGIAKEAEVVDAEEVA